MSARMLQERDYVPKGIGTERRELAREFVKGDFVLGLDLPGVIEAIS